MRPCRVTPESMHGLHRAAVVPQPRTTTCLPRSRVQVARVLVAGSGRLATRATTPTTSAERRRLSHFPSYPGVARDKLVRQAKRQLSSLASISRRQQAQRQPRVGTPHLRRAPRRTPHLRRAPRQGAVVAADSEQTVVIVEKMAQDGATSLLPTVTLALAPSIRPVRPHLAVEARQLQVLSQLQLLSRRPRHAPILIRTAQIGPPTESARRTQAGCWKIVVRAVATAPRQHRHHLHLHRHLRPPRRRPRPAPILISIAQIGRPVESVRRTLATCWRIAVRAAEATPAHHRSQLRRRQALGGQELWSSMAS